MPVLVEPKGLVRRVELEAFERRRHRDRRALRDGPRAHGISLTIARLPSGDQTSRLGCDPLGGGGDVGEGMQLIPGPRPDLFWVIGRELGSLERLGPFYLP